MRTRHDGQPDSWQLRLLAILTLLGLVLSLTGPASAQLDPDEVAGEPADRATADEPTAEPTAEPTEVPAVSADGEGAPPAEAAGEETATTPLRLTITVYRCNHPEYDTGFSGNIQLVLSQCTQPGYGTFTVEQAIGPATQSGQSLEFQVQFTNVIEEAVQPGYDHPIANCFVYDRNGNLVDQIGPGEAGSGFWKVSASNTNVHCDWYQVDRGLGTVYIVNMGCPATASLQPRPSMNELVAMCNLPAGQKAFLVDHGAGLTRQGITGGEFNDTHLEALHTGPIAIRLSDPAPFASARVFCQVNTIEGVEITPFAEFPVSGFQATGITLGHLQRLHCAWFNIAEGPGLAQGDDPPPVEPPIDDGEESPDDPVEPTPVPAEFRVALHTCPGSFDPDDEDADPMASCPEGPNGVTFTLSDDQATTPDLQAATGDTVPNRVVFSGIPGGNAVITQTVPPGIGTVFVLGCGGGGGIDPIPVIIDGSLQVSIPPGVIVTCHWFNIRGNTQDAGAGAASGPGTTQPGSRPTPTPVPGVVANPPREGVNEMPPTRTPLSILPGVTGDRAQAADVVDEPVDPPGQGADDGGAPAFAPGTGNLTVIHHTCAATAFSTAAGCPVNQAGQGFDLVWWNGDDWELADVGTTDESGAYTFASLQPGEYWLDEHDGHWCHLESDNLAPEGHWLNVYEGQETVVRIYSCA